MEHIVADGGLDLVRARPAVEPGRLQACLNYEVGWLRGYARIDGFERFDGSVSPSSTTGWVLHVMKTDVTGQFVAPESLQWSDGQTIGDSGTLVQVDDDGDHWRLFIVFRAGRVRPVYGVTLLGLTSGASLVLDTTVVPNLQTFPQYYPTVENYLQALDIHATTLRNVVRPVPGSGTIVGLHYHEDSLYAVRDVAQVTFSSAGSDQIQVGMYVYNSSNQIGLVISDTSGADDATTGSSYSIQAMDEEGFDVSAGEQISIALTVRFKDGSGEFKKLDDVRGTGGSPWVGETGYVDLRNGSWDSGNALGVGVFINRTSGAMSAGLEFNNQDAVGNMTIETVLFNNASNAAVVGSVEPKSADAALWQSTDEGWVPAPIGGLVTFNTGTDEIVDDYVAVEQTKYPGYTAKTGGYIAGTDFNPINNIRAKDGSYANCNFTASGAGQEIPSGSFQGSYFGFQLSSNDEVTGFAVEFSGVENDAFAACHFETKLRFGSNRNEFQTDDFVNGAVDPDLWAGADATNWLAGGNPSAADVSSISFGFEAKLMVANGQTTDFDLDSMRATVYYRTPTDEYLYLHDPARGTDVGFIRREGLPVLTEGAWDGTGIGYVRVSDWNPFNVQSGLEIRTAAGGAGGLIGVTTTGGNLTPILPGSLLLDQTDSRYEMISYNFFANEDKNAIYGVNGVGPAFTYDGKILEFIYTGLPIEQEKPRHVATHLFRLALGYQWGEVYFSQAGEPTSFDATLYAFTAGFGDKITGLMPAAGDALAVFTESTTNVFTGQAGDEQNPAFQKVINHKIGAIEYSVQSIGNRPIFASFRGIETLETMDEFSDFFTAPLTYDISPWLLERLQSAAGVEATDKSVVNSVVVRNKNQYRLFFADGYLCTLTLVGTEREPQNTIQRYWFESDWDRYARCYATASGVTTSGRDRAFFSVEERPAAPDAQAATVGPDISFVYELDRGRSFDGGEIIGKFSLTQVFGVDTEGQPAPQASARYNIFQIHGTAYGYAGIRMSRALNYEDIDEIPLPYELVTMGALEKPPEAEPKPKFAKGRMSGRGFAVTFHVEHTSSIEFPHVIQMITFLDDTAFRTNR